MSLRGFHLAFIALATALAFIIGVWGLGRGQYQLLGGVSIVLGLALLAYGIWFLRKVLYGKTI